MATVSVLLHQKWSEQLVARLTGYYELVLIGAPILIEQPLNVYDVVVLSDPCPKGMTGPHLNLRTHLGNRTNISAYAYSSACVRNKETKGVLALSRCPGPVACLL